MPTKFIQELIALIDNANQRDALLDPLRSEENIEIEVVDGFEEYLPDEDFDLEIFNQLLANFYRSATEIFRILNASILHGEYFSHQDFLNHRISLKEKFDLFIRKLKEDVVNSGNYYNPLNIYFRVVSKGISDFLNFSEGIGEKIKKSKSVYYTVNADENQLIEEFKLNTAGDSFGNTSYYGDFIDLYRLLRINIISSKDEFLMQSSDFEKLLSELLIDIKWLETKPNLGLGDAIKAKCWFLWSKIKFRIIEDSSNKVFFSDGSREIKVSLEENPFDYWIRFFKCHYEIAEDSKSKIRTAVFDKGLLTQDITGITSLLDLHLLIKYFKDCAYSELLDNLKEIRQEIGNRYIQISRSSDSRKFDVFAYSFAYNYAINNEFSYLLNIQSASPETVRRLYLDICKIQEQTSIDNFFPQWMYLKYLINKIKLDLEAALKGSDLSEIRLLLKDAREIFTKYDKNVYWTQNTYNYIFYLPFEECCVKFEDKRNIINFIFFASSFNLPLMKNKYVLNFNQSEIELSSLERSVEILSLINGEQSEIKNANASLLSDVRFKETKYIEILGIFGTVITFAAAAFTTILASSKSYESSQLTETLISIGMVLFLFMSLVLFITRIPIEKIWQKSVKLGLAKLTVASLIGIISIVITLVICRMYINHEVYQVKRDLIEYPKEVKPTDSTGNR